MSGIPLGALDFDAVYAVSQIVTVQAVFYALLTVVLQGVGLCVGAPSPDMWLVFVCDGALLFARYDVVCAHLIAAVGAGYTIHKAVERSKRCLDSTATLYALHLLLATTLLKLPATPACYLLPLACGALTLAVSRHLCMQSELATVQLRHGARGRAV